jgi:hypothetical protein
LEPAPAERSPVANQEVEHDMKTRSILTVSASAAAFLGLAVHSSVAFAGDMQPLAARTIDMGAVQGVAYYSEEADGLRLVATVSAGESAFRVISTLADNQKVILAVPRTVDQDEKTITFRRTGDSVSVSEVEAIVAHPAGMQHRMRQLSVAD